MFENSYKCLFQNTLYNVIFGKLWNNNMPVIILHTRINAPIDLCFDLSRNIDIHVESTSHTGEQAIAGKTSGLINLNETVTWRAKHLGIWQTLTTKITALEHPKHFRDEMTQGAFTFMKHDHYFRYENNITVMEDVFIFSSPFGLIGKLFNILFLTGYMKDLLSKRNAVIKKYAESISL